MKDRLLLLLYLGAVVAATFVHDPVRLAGALAVVLLGCGGRAPRVLGRALRAAAPFAAAVSLGWLAASWWEERPAGAALLRLNLRVLLMTCLTFALAVRIDLQRALGFSRTLRFALALAVSQVLTFRRLYADFRLALRSRSPRRASAATSLRHGAAAGAWFLRRAEHDAAEIAQALDARGFFLDRR
jgi:cobalt/nickel transport system permease protein